MDNSVLLYGSIVAGALIIISVIIVIVRKSKSKNGSTTSNSMRNMRNINPRDRMRARHELELLRRKFDKTSHFGKGGDDPWSKYLNSLSLDERKDEANRLLEIIHRKHKNLVNSGTNSNSFVRGGGATGGTAGGEILSRTGCTDSSATNYNSNAFIDDGSCLYTDEYSGCTDSTATNYDSNATTDDGSCEYTDDSINYVAVGSGTSSSIIYSTDGINWTDATDFDIFSVGFSVGYGNGWWVAAGLNASDGEYYFVRSQDGINWTQCSTSQQIIRPFFRSKSSNGNGVWVSACYPGSGGTYSLAYSENDGENWDIVSNNIFHGGLVVDADGVDTERGGYGRDVCYGNGYWVAVGGFGNTTCDNPVADGSCPTNERSQVIAAYSTNGTDWSELYLPYTATDRMLQALSVVYSGNTWIIGGITDITGRVAIVYTTSSPDSGAGWTTVSTVSSPSAWMMGINNRGVDDGGAIFMLGTDGEKILGGSSGTAAVAGGCNYDNENACQAVDGCNWFHDVGDGLVGDGLADTCGDPAVTETLAISSNSGETWTPVSSEFSRYVTCINYSNGIWHVGGETNENTPVFLSSTDGENWSTINSGLNNNIYGVAGIE